MNYRTAFRQGVVHMMGMAVAHCRYSTYSPWIGAGAMSA